MNHKEGSYQLSHVYDRFLGTGLTVRRTGRRNYCFHSPDEGGSRNAEVQTILWS